MNVASWLDALLGQIFGGGVEIPLAAGVNFTSPLAAARNPTTNVIDVTLPAASITPASLAVESSGLAALFVVHKAFTALAAGTADDVTVLSSAPFAFRILRTLPVITTAVAASSVRLRSASGGGGSALSSSFATDVATEDPVRSSPLTAFPSVALGGSLFLRRSDRGVAGALAVLCMRT